VDPVDGTRDFVRGTDRWAVLLGLEETEGGRILAGVAHFPVNGKTFYATPGGGAWLNDQRLRAASTSDIKQAVVHVNGLIKPHKMPYRDHLLDWCSQCFAIRSMGGAPDAMLLAEGRADVWIEPDCKAWDLAPLKVILEEAGLKFMNLDGGSSIYANNALVFVPALEAEVRKLVGSGS
jgi:histidinol-phosphatase